MLAGLPSNIICPLMVDLPFKIIAAAHRRHGSALPGKPGPSMSVSMLFVDKVHNLGFSAPRLAVESFSASLGFNPVKKRLRLQAETLF